MEWNVQKAKEPPALGYNRNRIGTPQGVPGVSCRGVGG